MEFWNRFAAKHPETAKMGTRRRTVCHRIESHYCFQVSALAVLTESICKFAGS